MSSEDNTIKINTLVLDAGPLITQSASQLQRYAHNFVTTPGVYNELKDEFARSQLLLWDKNLKVRHPKPNSIKAVADFARITGDYSVLSQNDIHILALVYEMECELNNGAWRLRNYPGEKKEFGKKKDKNSSNEEKDDKEEDKEEEKEDGWTTVESKTDSKEISTNIQSKADFKQEPTEVRKEEIEESKSFEPEQPFTEQKKKKTRRGGKRHRNKAQAQSQTQTQSEISEQPEKESLKSSQKVSITIENTQLSETELNENYSDAEDDGEWITPENLHEEMLKDDNERVETSGKETAKIKAALATGDFAIQNVALQIGLNLMNYTSGLQIKRVRNYMFRCHACFNLTPIPKDGTPKHFCPSCGGNTLLRCAVSINAKTGDITPHLKKNFIWHTRGDRYSMPSPLSKNHQKRYGHQGYQHRGNSNLEDVYLREDQKEYQQAIKNAKWQLRQNEKAMQEFVGGGSADNFISPFFTGTDHTKPIQVKVGKGRYVNSSRKRK